MADERPKRQRTVRSCTEFFGASLLPKEEVELRRALHASLKEARNVQQKKQGKSVEPVVETRSICTNTNTRIRIKGSAKNKSDKNHKGNSLEETKRENEKEESKLFPTSSQVLANSKNRTDVETFERRKPGEKVLLRKNEAGKCVDRKELQSPTKQKVTKPSKGKELKILPQSKASRKSLNCKKVKRDKESKVVQSLTEKFRAVEKVGKHQSTACNKRRKDYKDQSLIETSSNEVKKKKTTLQKAECVTVEQISCSTEETESNTSESVCELQQQVQNGLQGKLRRKIKHKLKDRKLVNPLGEIYIPANIAKTEDFLTFLCLRGNANLPRSFEVFNNPDPFVTQPAHQCADEGVFSSPVLPIHSSVTYSPPSSSAPSETSAPSPLSSTDGWLINDD